MDIKQFITNYKTEDKNNIIFKWNGKHAEKFEDENYWFRSDVIDYILDDDIKAPSELLRDLLDEESKCSVESWGIRVGMHDIGSKLLKQLKTKYVEDFMVAKNRSFDTECGIVAYISSELAQELSDYFSEKKKNIKDIDEQKFYNYCHKYFLSKID